MIILYLLAKMEVILSYNHCSILDLLHFISSIWQFWWRFLKTQSNSKRLVTLDSSDFLYCCFHSFISSFLFLYFGIFQRVLLRTYLYYIVRLFLCSANKLNDFVDRQYKASLIFLIMEHGNNLNASQLQ